MSEHTLAVDAVEEGTPKAIVILFGWLGSSPRHVQKYAKLYQDRKCSTIYGTADVLVRIFCIFARAKFAPVAF